MKKNTMRRTLPLLGVAVVLSACLLAAGCTGQAPDGTDNESVQGIDLNGTAWDLVSYAQNGSMKDALTGTTVSLVFGENNTASGSAGCNSYSTSYTLDGTAITFGPAVSTLMFCPQEGVMEQESAYLRLLDTVKTYEVKDETLTFFDENGTAVLVFGKHVPPAPEPLVGTEWELQWYHDGDAVVSVISGTTITAVFDEEGKVAGSAGCNRYFASYEVNGTEMTIGPAGSTLMACPDEDVMKQESAYLALIDTVKTFTIEGETLTFFDENGTKILVFAKAVPPQPEPLVGTEWSLVSYHADDAIVSVIADTTITAVFDEEGKVAGSAGCNRYFASYTVDGTEMTLGTAGTTLRACLNEDVAEQERTYLALLNTTASFAIEGETLTLFDENGTKILTFAKVNSPQPEPLVGTEWSLVSYHADDAIVSVLAGTEITAVFDEKGNVAGSAGCNRYFASYEVNGTGMTLGTVGMTQRACLNEDVAEQERTYLALLNTTASFAIEGDRLSLMDENGMAVLVFVKTEGPTALPLVGTTWVLDTYHLGDIAVRVIEGTEITAVFDEDGKVAGSAGCNNYFASYNLSESSLTFGPAGSTKKICAEPEGIMEQEERYLSILKAVRSYEIEGNQLELFDMNGWRIFAFTAKP